MPAQDPTRPSDTRTSSTGPEPLPPGTRLVHIGPHKTGTTAVQSAFHLARKRLAERGIVYTKDRHPVRSALAVTGRPQLLGEPAPDTAHWNRLVARFSDLGDAERAVVSSEFFAEADDDVARRVVRDLGGPRAHIVVTLRPLAKILPSQWQQYVQNGTRMAYDAWLDSMFNKPPYTKPNPTFWRRHHHGRLVERWTAAAGPDNVTVVIVDESDRKMLLHTFEALLGLPRDFLVPGEGRENRSLTRGETEIVRHFNRAFKELPWPVELYARYMRKGAVMHMKTGRQPPPDEPRIVTPTWALKRAAEIGGESARTISELGVRVVGDISTLSGVPDSGTVQDAPDSGTVQDVPDVSPEAAAHAVLGAIYASGDVDPPAVRVEERRVKEVTAADLAGVLWRRIKRRVRRTVRRTGADADSDSEEEQTPAS